MNQDGTEQIDNFAELWSKGICVVREGVTPTQAALLSCGRSGTAAVTIATEGECGEYWSLIG